MRNKFLECDVQIVIKFKLDVYNKYQRYFDNLNKGYDETMTIALIVEDPACWLLTLTILFRINYKLEHTSVLIYLQRMQTINKISVNAWQNLALCRHLAGPKAFKFALV